MGQNIQKVQVGSRSTPNQRSVGNKGWVGAEGKPPGFKVVRHPPAKKEPSSGSGRVSTCGSINRD